MIVTVGVVGDGAGVAVTVRIETAGVCGDVAVTIMVAIIGVCGEVADAAVTVMEVTVRVCGDVAGVAVPSMTAIVDVCSDVADVAVLFRTAIVRMSGGGGALTVTINVVAPTAGAVLFAFGAVGMAIARVKRASNIRMNGIRIVGERLLEGLVRMSEEFEG